MFSCFMNSIRKNMLESCRLVIAKTWELHESNKINDKTYACINLTFNYLAYKIAGCDMRCYKSHAKKIKKMYF